MPIYEYACRECRIKREKLWKLSSRATPTIPCPKCGEDMPKVPSVASFAFKHKAGVRGALPPNTGTSDDWNFDKAVGRDSEKKWVDIEKRNAVKDRRVRHEREAGRAVTRDHLIPTKEGDYRVITEKERVRVNQNRDAAFKVAQAKKAAPKTSGQ